MFEEADSHSIISVMVLWQGYRYFGRVLGAHSADASRRKRPLSGILHYNIRPATAPNPTIAAKLSTTFLPAAPVNMGIPAEFVALPIMPPPPPMVPLGAIDMLMMDGLVALFPAAHDGTATGERVTMTSAGMPVGQPGLMVMTDVALSSLTER